MKNKISLTLGILSITLTSFIFSSYKFDGDDKKKDGIDFFHGTWKEALAKSKKSKKPIFVDAYTSWCGPCRWMSANTFPNKEVGKYFNENFINMKINMEKGEGLTFSKTYKITAYPTLLFIDGEGKVIKRVMGAKAPEQFLTLGKSVPKDGKSESPSTPN